MIEGLGNCQKYLVNFHEFIRMFGDFISYTPELEEIISSNFCCGI
jgi:hypothetical protein